MNVGNGTPCRGTFEVWAAVDLLEGRAVRLRQGDPRRRTDYGPALEAALGWLDAGLRRMHVVDLGAALGGPSCLRAFVEDLLSRRPGAVVQAAGGLRSRKEILRVMEAGAARVVLGSVLLERPREAEEILRDLGPDRTVAALDGREGRLRVRGWTADGGLSLPEAVDNAAAMGFETVLVTDVARDGEGTGPHLGLYRSLARPGLRLLGSGGIRGMEDLKALAALPGVGGAVVGRALYEGKVRPGDLLEAERWFG